MNIKYVIEVFISPVLLIDNKRYKFGYSTGESELVNLNSDNQFVFVATKEDAPIIAKKAVLDFISKVKIVNFANNDSEKMELIESLWREFLDRCYNAYEDGNGILFANISYNHEPMFMIRGKVARL